ncbi:uncharacterized protein RJT21DRAFT_116749 [Scheffersomyces amazonensis]|uniref:uncharacterized protein n=1 Tax=Scheffersomyces amazonensis TaxID=1078765 RepID=UPI00315DCAE1
MADSRSVLSSSEVAFPRGGSTALTPLEVKEISNEATKDVLFEASKASKRSSSSTSTQPNKKSKKKKNVKSEDNADDESSVQIENFNFKNIIPGSLVLGQITAIGKLDITLSIGDNLVGFIPITSISEEITSQLESFEEESEEESEEEAEAEAENENEIQTATLKTKTKEFPDLKQLFKIGQWLKAKVVQPNDSKKKKIQFSIEAEVVNSHLELEDLTVGNILQGSIKSIEDHGIILSTGKSGLAGFISNKEIQNSPNLELEELKVGQVLLTSIAAKASTRSITLKPIQNAKKISITSISSVDAIQPGIIVDALVSDITKNGLVTKVFGLVDGTINLSHVQIFDLQALKHKYTIGNTIKARVLAVIPKAGTKKLILSALPQLQSLSSIEIENPLEAFPIGHVFDEVTIVGTDPNYLYVSFGSSTLFGQIHNSKIDSNKSLDIDYTKSTKHKARVLGFNSIDNVLILTLQPEVVDAKYLHSSDIPNGTLVLCEILKVLPENGGIIIKSDQGFEGFVSGIHMSDVRLVYPERKFKTGTKVKGRVLYKKGKNLIITFKKSLVNIEDEDVLCNFEDAKIGSKSPATVEKFVHGGAIVSFFGTLKAFLPKNEISETFVDKASDYLKLGQTVITKVLDIKSDQKRIIVTLRQSSELSKSQKLSIDELIPGKSIIQVSVVEKAKESIIVELQDSNLRGVIFSGHLSDGNYEQNRAILKRLPIGEKLQVLVLEKDLKARTIIVSAKKSLIEASKQSLVPGQFKEIKIDDKMLKGFIKSVTNMGLFISFAGKLTGLVLAKYATDKENEDLSSKFYKYQSVSCRVIRIDEENKRFLLSLKDTSGSNDSEPTINPIDTTKQTISDYSPGIITKALIKSIKGTQLNVQLADNLQGRIDITQCFNSWEEIKDKKQPLSQFHKGQIIDAKILGFHDAKNHRFLPITHRKSNKNIILELSILKKELTTSTHEELKLSDISIGSEYLVFVNNLARGYIWTSISPSIKGRISFMELPNDITSFEDLDNQLPIGTALKAIVKDIDNEHHVANLTTGKDNITSIKNLEIGKKYPSRVLKVRDSYVLVELGDNVVASAFITDALNDYSEKLENIFHANDFAIATILNIDHKAEKVAVSLRTSEATDKLINSITDLNRGDVVKGFVKNIANNGVYIALGRSVHALARVSDLSDSYLKDWKKFFKPHQQVIGKISACKEEGRILITLKETEVNGELNYLKRFEDLEVGQVYEGSVRRVTEFGVFVKLDGTVSISGLCHRSQIADTVVENPSSLFGEGDRVKVKILQVDQEKKQLSLGMKASYFTETSSETQEDVEMEDAESEADEEEVSDDEDEDDNDEVLDEDEDEDDDEVLDEANFDDNDSDNSEDEDEDESSESSNKISGLSTNGFDWTASILDQAEADESSSDEEDFTQEKKRFKKTQRRVEDKTADINTRAPQSVSDFERLLIGNPSSSILWMNYMSFQLQLSEIDKAREIGERALKTINYREEAEKMNIWIALLNLENTFGTDETLEETFKRATQYLDSFVAHQKLVGIYTMSEKYNKAQELYKVMSKKFGKNVNVWVQYGSFLLDRKDHEGTREVLARSLQVLPKRDHIEVVRKFAQLEFSKGDAEQGRSLFEGLVTDAPKRIDIWNVYIDQEIKLDEKSKVEELFERVLAKKISRKQAKFFFGKWLSYEEEKGDEKMSVRVRAKATQYVQDHSKEE